jgi:purine-nucleoside phosphorylase
LTSSGPPAHPTTESDRTPRVPAHDLERRVAEAVRVVRARTAHEPRVALTLGSGLGGAIDALDDAVTFATTDLPHWPRSTVAGHAGRVALGRWAGVPVVALAGRSHRYEGYSIDRVTFGVRVMRALGATTMIFTNAVGGIHPELAPGDLMLATGHINFIAKRDLLTPAELAERRTGLGRARPVPEPYDAALRERLSRAAAEAGVPLRTGTLMGGHGPTYETAAEVRLASRLGASVACMSTVHEVLLAAELGCACASISCVTNRATGLSATPLTHHEVTEVADRVAGRLRAVITRFLERGPSAT